jgi:hypothetical protein
MTLSVAYYMKGQTFSNLHVDLKGGGYPIGGRTVIMTMLTWKVRANSSKI